MDNSNQKVSDSNRDTQIRPQADSKNKKPLSPQDLSANQLDPRNVSGSDEDSYKAATRGTEIETHDPHPTKIPHPREDMRRP